MIEPSFQAFEILARLYGFVTAGLTTQPSTGNVASMRKQLPALIRATRALGEPLLSQSVENTRLSLKGSTSEVLSVDHAGLFAGGKAGTVCPSESSYLENILFGQTSMEVIEFYAKNGFIKETGLGEPDDHLAFECAFMSALAWDCAAAIRKEGLQAPAVHEIVRARLTFLAEHLSRWVRTWVEDVQRFAETRFYKALADLIAVLVDFDMRFLSGFSDGENTSRIVRSCP
jgi:putative dimethyl sulfoxide reductase chaperone